MIKVYLNDETQLPCCYENVDSFFTVGNVSKLVGGSELECAIRMFPVMQSCG